MKLSKQIRCFDEGSGKELPLRRWSDKVAKLEAELEMYERDETFGTLAIQLAQLEEELTDRKEADRKVLADECAPDEKHCTCVPALKKENRDIKRTIDAQQVWVEKYKTQNKGLREGIHNILQQLQAPRTDTLPLREALADILEASQ